jgi:NADPH-dependent 2,4-dienoyl-CoA reductase/sulfur reductase-like enzyme
MPSHSSSSAPIATVLVCAAALTGAAWARHHSASKKTAAKLVAGGASSSMPLPAGAFDVVVVGAGPAGCTAAYYLAKGGARVALLEREKSPR